MVWDAAFHPFNRPGRRLHHPTSSPSILRHMAEATARWGAALVLCAAPLAQASTTTYTYTAPGGGWYDAGGHGFALYNQSDASGIRFEFTTAAPIASVGNAYDAVDVTSQVLSWSYHGDSPFLNFGSASSGAMTLLLTTLADGSIFFDKFYVGGAVVIPGLEAYHSSFEGSSNGYDQLILHSDYLRIFGYDLHGQPYYSGLGEYMSNQRGAGHWAMRTNADEPAPGVVPEPASLALVLAAGMLGALASRRR